MSNTTESRRMLTEAEIEVEVGHIRTAFTKATQTQQEKQALVNRGVQACENLRDALKASRGPGPDP